ncbi:MAG: hypothetical protein QOJ62_2375 [Actinomycetota bacterium]|nr:hypothetical protein [Actinomycetota bacterium]
MRVHPSIALPAASTQLLTITEVIDVGPRMRRVTLSGGALAQFVALPGQDVVLHLDVGQAGKVSRRYTIRNLDHRHGRFDLDFVMHGHGPGAAWAGSVQIGDEIEIFGPRGKVLLAERGWHLFAGDESALPGIAEMIGALPAGPQALAFIEVHDDQDEQSIEAAARIDVRWLHRSPTAPGQAHLLDEVLQTVAIPDADRHAYLFGESRVVRRLRDLLAGRGLRPDEISAKGYWNLGRPAGD